MSSGEKYPETRLSRPELRVSYTAPALGGLKLMPVEEATSATPPAAPSHTFTYTPTAPLLFRYSALTYNAHRIHYDRDWCKSVENHPDLVVHGPLTATLLVELAERVALDTGRHLRRFEYRATSPMYVDREILMEATPMEGQEGKVEMTAKQEGRVGMRAVATFEGV
jgi:hydroxyacyl-ACP dehydratase HTD2-like protein with hotdog domain